MYENSYRGEKGNIKKEKTYYENGALLFGGQRRGAVDKEEIS